MRPSCWVTYRVGVPDRGASILAEVTPAAVSELELLPGRPIWAAVKASAVAVYPRDERVVQVPGAEPPALR